MNEKTEEQIAKNKAAIDAMKNAKANMDVALKRIDELEAALLNARTNLNNVKQYISANVYMYKPDNQMQRTVHAWLDACIASADKVRG